MSGMHRDRLNRSGKFRKIRHVIQICSAVFFNGYIAGLRNGRIFTGKTKLFCVPVLNCYSCPAALGACPIGSLQAVLGTAGGRFPFYVLGILMLFGVILGRAVCGLLCPFGLLQDLLSRIPVRKVSVPGKADCLLRYVKYVILTLFVILLPAFFTDGTGGSVPWFCKFICPAGTLEGGIPLLILNPDLRSLAGPLFMWKMLLLAVTVTGAIFIRRFFCRYLCPLGAFYSLFSKFSLIRMKADRASCIECGKCSEVCPMSIDPVQQINGTECILCGRCGDACPSSAISYDLPVLTESSRK
ncbi:MAG: 4Fe-4S binding protein [Oscillospiraceae bacterium]|nr:4Fe-4S binding protein [Oscillospiraceae bacterium]